MDRNLSAVFGLSSKEDTFTGNLAILFQWIIWTRLYWLHYTIYFLILVFCFICIHFCIYLSSRYYIHTRISNPLDMSIDVDASSSRTIKYLHVWVKCLIISKGTVSSLTSIIIGIVDSDIVVCEVFISDVSLPVFFFSFLFSFEKIYIDSFHSIRYCCVLERELNSYLSFSKLVSLYVNELEIGFVDCICIFLSDHKTLVYLFPLVYL